MPRLIRCPVCERQHTIDEYEEDRFCRTCSALLKVEDKASGKGFKDFFPYDPYPPQIEFMDDVERIVGGGENLIAEACNGFGKTASALSALLPSGRPIVYATRTHEQVRQVLLEVATINKSSRKKFKAVNLASRQHLCINLECQDLPRRDAQELCRALREEGECSWDSEITVLPKGLSPVMTQKTLISTGRRHGVCPYYLARSISKGCRVVVVPYPYVFNREVRSSVGLELTGRILVMDEGHNLDKVGQDTLSDTLSEFALGIAGDELKAINRTTKHTTRLARLLRKKITDKPLLQPASALERDLELILGSKLEIIIDQYADTVEKIRAHKLQLGDAPASYMNGVLSFLGLVAGSDKSKYIALYHRTKRGDNTLEYRCLDPSLAVKPVVDSTTGTLIMSGTLSPLEFFAEVVGLDDAKKKAYPAIQDPDNIRTLVDPGLTTTYRNRSEEMIFSIGNRIVKEIKGVCNGALIFFPQRGFMNKCLDVWGENGVIETKKGRHRIGGKLLFIEGASANSNRDRVVEYKSATITPEGAVLCCVFRGRNSEGSNFPGPQARGIFLVGVPYANFSDPLVRAQINFYNKKEQGLGQRWYTMDAFKAANQAIGRGIRGVDDWCHYWLLDRRYAERIQLISQWALGHGPELIKN